MARQIACAKCGAPHDLANPGISMLVCGHCQAVLYWGEDQAVRVGRESMVPEGDTRLYLHAQGQVQGQAFQVIGHLLYQHGAGTWDEWYLSMADGTELWLSEDERQLRLQRSIPIGQSFPTPAQMRSGQQLSVGGHDLTVREIGTATLVAGEGQLPYVVMPGESYPYAELASADGAGFVTLEYDDDGAVHGYIGQPIDHGELALDQERQAFSTSGKMGRNIECKNCKAALESPRPDVQTLVCDYCGAALELSSGQQNILGMNPEGQRPPFHFEVGDAATFDGVRYEVCGRMQYADLGEWGVTSREYLLYNGDRGYLWLAEYENHFVLSGQTDKLPGDPSAPWYASPKAPVAFDGRLFQKYEAGAGQLTYVDGALPYRASVGQTFEYSELVKPPEILTVERSDEELDAFLGSYRSQSEVWEAFGREDEPPSGRGVHGAQPFVRTSAAKTLMWIGAICAMANVALLVWSMKQRGSPVFQEVVESTAYLEGSVSEPFSISDVSMLTLSLDASVSNSWVVLEVALVDDDTGMVQAESGGEVAYYHGVEGGESWSEGSSSKKVQFRAPPPGNYRLIYKGTGGSGTSGGPQGEPVRVTVRAGGVLSRYFLFAGGFALLFPLLGIISRMTFEARRWAPVTEDDDD